MPNGPTSPGRDDAEPTRRDRERQSAIDALQAAITDGIQSGPAAAFDLTDFKRRMRQRRTAK